jgi:hypothetical protein
MIASNATKGDAERLEREDFVLDVKERERLQLEQDVAVQELRLETELEVGRSLYVSQEECDLILIDLAAGPKRTVLAQYYKAGVLGLNAC